MCPKLISLQRLVIVALFCRALNPDTQLGILEGIPLKSLATREANDILRSRRWTAARSRENQSLNGMQDCIARSSPEKTSSTQSEQIYFFLGAVLLETSSTLSPARDVSSARECQCVDFETRE